MMNLMGKISSRTLIQGLMNYLKMIVAENFPWTRGIRTMHAVPISVSCKPDWLTPKSSNQVAKGLTLSSKTGIFLQFSKQQNRRIQR